MGIFRWSGQKGPVLSLAEVRALVEMALPELEVRLRERVWRTHTGVVTEKRLAEEVTEACETRTDAFTPKLLAGELGILDEDKNAAEFILGVAEEHKAMVSGGQIYPRKVVEDLTQQLLSQTQVVVPSSKVCSQLHISVQALKHLVRTQNKVVLVGDAVALRQQLERLGEDFAFRVSTATEPIDVATLEPDELTRNTLIAQSGPFEGSFDGTVFTPRSFTAKLKQKCVNILREKGYVSEAELSENDHKDAAKFARKNNAVFTKGYVVQEEYIAMVTADIKKELASSGYFDLHQIEIPAVIQESLDIKTAPGYSHYLVRPSFETQIASEISEKLHQDAVDAAVNLDYRPESSERSLIAQIALPDVAKVQSLIEVRGDATLEKELAKKIVEKVRQKYLETARIEVSKHLEDAQHDTELKLSAYLRGVLSVKNEVTQNLLYQEWEQYVINTIGTAPGPLDQAKITYNTDSTVELCMAATKFVARIIRQLRSTPPTPKNAALVLHLAVVIWHATRICHGDGTILKTTGKLVPKILKEFEFPEKFNELRQNIRDPSPELVEEVKNIGLEFM